MILDHTLWFRKSYHKFWGELVQVFARKMMYFASIFYAFEEIDGKFENKNFASFNIILTPQHIAAIKMTF